MKRQQGQKSTSRKWLSISLIHLLYNCKQKKWKWECRMLSTKRAAHAQRSAFPLSFLLLGCIASRLFLLGVYWAGQPGEGGAETDRNHLQGTRVCPSPLGFPCVPPRPALRLLLTQWVTNVLCVHGTAGGPAGGTSQLHPHQQPRGNSGAGAVCGAWVWFAACAVLAHEGQPGTACAAAVVLGTGTMVGPHGLTEFLKGSSGSGGFCLPWISELFRDLGQTSKTGWWIHTVGANLGCCLFQE